MVGVNNTKNIACVKSTLIFLSVCAGCAEAKENADCETKWDCEAPETCVFNQCVSEKSECETIGVFDTISSVSLQNASMVDDFSVTFDHQGAVHYCYTGGDGQSRVSYYGHQIDNDQFVEEPLKLEDKLIRCGGIIVTGDGTPFVLSKSPAVLMVKTEGEWRELPLQGLSDGEKASSFKSDETMVSLVDEEKNNIYISVSMGLKILDQSLYIARVDKNKVEVLLDGWGKNDEHTIIGYAPQVAKFEDGLKLIANNLYKGKVLFSDMDLNIAEEIDGTLPKITPYHDGVRSVYLNYNNEMVISHIDSDYQSNEIITKIKNVYAPEKKGRIPWDLAIDSTGNAHVLIENSVNDQDKLIYLTSAGNGRILEHRLVSDDILWSVSGNYLYDIRIDKCDRSEIVGLFAEKEQNKTNGYHPVIKIMGYR